MMKLIAPIAALGLLAACGGSSPTEPEPPTLPASGAEELLTSVAPAGAWTLDWRLDSVKGNIDCWVAVESRYIGTGADQEPLKIERSGTSIVLTYLPDDPFGGMVYQGELDGQSVRAHGPSFPASIGCPDGTHYHSQVEIRVTGTFSDDWQSLQAKEVWDYRTGTEGRVALTYRWHALRTDASMSAIASSEITHRTEIRSATAKSRSIGKEIDP